MWLEAIDNVFEYEFEKNGHEQRFVYDALRNQYYYEFEDEGVIELDYNEVPENLREELESILELD